jgi:hypothetical protein
LVKIFEFTFGSGTGASFSVSSMIDLIVSDRLRVAESRVSSRVRRQSSVVARRGFESRANSSSRVVVARSRRSRADAQGDVLVDLEGLVVGRAERDRGGHGARVAECGAMARRVGFVRFTVG